MAISDHEFGGVSTDLKLSMVHDYLSAFTRALESKFSERWYIDAFAGTGERTVRLDAIAANLFNEETPDRVERRRGSAQLAIDTAPPFNRLIFMDQKAKHCEALRALAKAHPEKRIDVLQGEANAEIRRLIANHSWASTRAVMFLDPYGMSVEWETLRAIRGTGAIDVWYLVSLAGLFRQAARDESALDEKKSAALTRMLAPMNGSKPGIRITRRVTCLVKTEYIDTPMWVIWNNTSEKGSRRFSQRCSSRSRCTTTVGFRSLLYFS
jgi:three-Cys-motif partner protein